MSGGVGGGGATPPSTRSIPSGTSPLVRGKPHQEHWDAPLVDAPFAFPSSALLLWRLAKLSRDEAPRGSQPAFAAGRYRPLAQPLSGPLQASLRFLRNPKPAALAARLTARFPHGGGRWVFHVPRTYPVDGLGPDFPPVTALSAAGHRQIPAPGHSPFGSSLLPFRGTAPWARC